MASMLNALRNVDLLFEFGDPRSAKLPMMGTPWATVVLVTSYVYFVKVLGPAMMKDRKPYDLRTLMVIYNIALVVINFYLFFEIGTIGWFGKYNLLCQPIDYSTSDHGMRCVRISWFFLMTRFVEFGDTIFFVLRKKFDHISPLHLFHHASVPLWVWIGVKVGAGGQLTFFPFLNCFIHVIMYTYYAIAALGPNYKKYIGWKRYLTILQLAQFAIAFIHGLLPIWIDCGYPRTLSFLTLFNAIMFWFLFVDFYKKSYTAKKFFQNGFFSRAAPITEDNALRPKIN